jgi:hypothetical protein
VPGSLDNPAGDQPVKEHTNSGEMLLDCQLRGDGPELLDIRCNVHRLDERKAFETSALTSNRELRDGDEVGAPGIAIPDVDGEELPKARPRSGVGRKSAGSCPPGEAPTAASMRVEGTSGAKVGG